MDGWYACIRRCEAIIVLSAAACFWVQVQDNIRNETDEEIGLRHKQDYEDIQKSYAELESVYVKFLADSGMSKSGYWRGSGVPTTAQLDDGEPR